MQNFNTPAVPQINTRPAFVQANPINKAAHRAAQRAMFGAANRFGLGINAAFGLKGSQRIISRTQMTIDEQRAIATAIESGLFDTDWAWGMDFTISRVEVQEFTQTRTVLHFTPMSAPTFTPADEMEFFAI